MANTKCDLCGCEISVWRNPYDYLGMKICGECNQKLTISSMTPEKRLRFILETKSDNSNAESVEKAVSILKEETEKDVEAEIKNETTGREMLEHRINNLRTFMVSSSAIANYSIVETLGMVNGECVIGSGAISSAFAGVSDVFGTVTDKGSKKFIIARRGAENAMLTKAIELQADAVVDVRYTFLQYSDSIQGLLVFGTAVRIEKNREMER